MGDDDVDKVVFNVTAVFIAKCYKFFGKPLSTKEWKIIPLHNYGLMQQKDNYNCGVYACLNAYSLLTFKDLPVRKSH